MRIAMICSGNICRSPMAEALVRKRGEDLGLNIQAISMGTLGLFAERAARNAVTALSEWDIDLSRHHSQGLNLAILGACDHIFGMEDEHVTAVRRADPSLAGKTHLLGKWDSTTPSDQIADPVNKDLAQFQTCRNQIDRAIRAFLEEQRRFVRRA